MEHGYNFQTPKSKFGSLAFVEFDPSLKNSLLFSNITASKCYFMNEGLEEIRGITAYQIMHL